MERVGKHISNLLFDHDCVIVPSLGGFLASNQPSRILVPNNIIYPPYRKIAFNVYLKQNDGLLANHLSEEESISYNEASQLIENYANDCFYALDNGKKVSIERVGQLFYDKEKNIQFEAFRNFNLLKESFGMEPIHFIPITREDKPDKRKIAPEKIIRPSVPQPFVKVQGKSFDNVENERRQTTQGKKSKSRRGRIYLGVTLVVIASVWVVANLYLIKPREYEATTLNPFDSQEISIPQNESGIALPSDQLKTESENTGESIQEPAVTEPSMDESLTSSSETTIKKPAEEIAPPITSPLVTEPAKLISASYRNHVIAGVFKIKENAQSMLLKLQQLGYKNARIIEANRCNYVTYDSFETFDQALVMTDSIHKNKLEGWVWEH